MIASTTRGWLWPTFATPTPPTKSTNVLPSTSVIVDPRARSATIGSWTMSGRATACRSRSRISRLRGPGISVRISITRVAATRGSLAMKHPVPWMIRPRWLQIQAWLDEDARRVVAEPTRDDARDRNAGRRAVGAHRPAARDRRARPHVLHEPRVSRRATSCARIRALRSRSTGGSSAGRCASRGRSRRSRMRESAAPTGRRDRAEARSPPGRHRSRGRSPIATSSTRASPRRASAVRRRPGSASTVLGRVPRGPRGDRALGAPRRPPPRPAALRARRRRLAKRAPRAVATARRSARPCTGPRRSTAGSPWRP